MNSIEAQVLAGIILMAVSIVSARVFPGWFRAVLRWGADRRTILKDHDSLALQLIAVTTERDDLRHALSTAAQFSAMNQGALGELRQKLTEIEARAAETEERLEARLDEQQLAVLDAVKYIADLTVVILDNGDPKNVPKPPSSIGEQVRQEIMVRIAGRAAARELEVPPPC